MQHPACRHVWHILRVRDTTGVTQVASSRFSFQTPGSSVTLLHLTIRCTRTCIRTRSGLTFDWLWLILRACCASRRRFDAREIEFLRARLKIRSMAFAHRTRRNSTHRPYPRLSFSRRLHDLGSTTINCSRIRHVCRRATHFVDVDTTATQALANAPTNWVTRTMFNIRKRMIPGVPFSSKGESKKRRPSQVGKPLLH